ncbi:reverse transcriptase [Tanacetum coccineum]|uniref:Reverse transcriptase n=1 Tax=Tanacetum coccineum TaxID=301880 RepID=A0ABQ4ZKG8_9ASTR
MNTTPNLEAGLATIQSSLDQINESIRGLLLFQQFATTEINSLKMGKEQVIKEVTTMEANMEDLLNDNYKIRLVSMHMFNKALNWHKQFVKRFGEQVAWGEYEREIKLMFDSVYEDPMVELKNLRQTTTVQVYHDLFEGLMNKVKLTESYAISLFIGGLRDEINIAVRMFKPTKLTDTGIVNTNVNSNGGNSGKNMTPAQNSTNVPNKPFKRLTQQELEEKRAKHLCFYCDKKYMPEHKCSGQVFSLKVVVVDVEEDGDLLLTEERVVNTYHSTVDEQPLISLNALSGVNTYRTMRVRGCVGRNTLHVLMDSDSTHNFLDLQTAKKLGYKLRKVCPLDVSVANGNVISSMYECKEFTLVFQGVTYTTDVMILPLRGCDMVLGVQWLPTLGCI